jgi:CheY-like chemotaxis protein
MPRTILLVEDSEDDVFFMTRAFKAAGLLTPLAHVENGQKAIDYLSGKQPYKDRTQSPLPSLILLDLKMPFLSGFEVLRWIRSQSAHARVPVIVFTTSNQERDVETAYELGANAYLVKPDHADQCSDLANLIKRFWLDANVPPPVKAIETCDRAGISPVRSTENAQPN